MQGRNAKRAQARSKIENIAATKIAPPSGWDKLSATQRSQVENAIQNGLGEALGLFNPYGMGAFNVFGFPQNQGAFGTQPLSNATTIFNNLRWYFVSNFRQVLCEAYVELGLIQTICDVPVDDAFRGGIEIKSKQLSPSQIEDLQISVDRDDDLNTIAQTAKWNRLFGGAGTLILTDQDPMTPLDLDEIGLDTPLEFRSVDMWELFWDKQNTEGYDPAIQTEDFEFYNYYAEMIHKSRVMRMKGRVAPSFLRPRLRGWGFSVVEMLIRSINQYLKATDLAFEVLDEFKIDVYKLKNLVNTLMSPNGSQKVQQRACLANQIKNFQSAIIMDGEDDYQQKQLSFAGLSETMAGIRMQIASDMRIPITKLFGTSVSSGFKTDQNDMENYNSMVESEVRNKVKYDILRMLEIKCQKLFGFVPDDLRVSFFPLRMLTAEEEENVKTQQFNRLLQAQQAGLITPEAFADGCNAKDLLPLKVEPVHMLLRPGDPEQGDQVEEGMEDPASPEDIDDPGANREDTRKTRSWDYVDAEIDAPYEEHKNPAEVKSADPSQNKPPRGDEAKETAPAKPTLRKRENSQPPPFRHSTKPPPMRAVHTLPKPWTRAQLLARRVQGPAKYDAAAYAADGGDSWIPHNALEKIMNPGRVDEALWEKAKKASEKAFGSVKWPFVTWWYKKQGGTFK